VKGGGPGCLACFESGRGRGSQCHARSGKRRRLGASVNGRHRRRAESPHDVCCRDFIFDRTESGSQLEWLSVIDEFTRECLTLKVDRGTTSGDAIDTPAERFAMRGVPKHARSDNGPEFIATKLRAWLGRVGVSTLSIDPGSPRENGCAESFHSRFRDERLALGASQTSADRAHVHPFPRRSGRRFRQVDDGPEAARRVARHARDRSATLLNQPAAASLPKWKWSSSPLL